jgi:hypothetical protein
MAGNETIVDRVVARLKAQPLGDLITEEDLHDVVKSAIPRVFFEERVVKDGSYHTKTLPPIIVEQMRELLKESAAKAVTDWVRENPQLLADYWKQVCDAGLVGYVQGLQNQEATKMLRAALYPFFQRLSDERAKMGLPFLPVNF